MYKTKEQKEIHNIASRKYYQKNKAKHYLLCKRRKQEIAKLRPTKPKQDPEILKAIMKEKDRLKYIRRKPIIQQRNKKNREIINAKYREHISNRMKNDSLFKLSRDIPKLIRISIKRYGYSKDSKTYSILGCTYEELKNHLESKFETWMNWENRGKYNGELRYGWDIDHVIPVSSAKTKEEMIKLNHYKNLQPLDSFINRYVKSNKVA
jgi:hypothetical protein